MTDRDDTDTPEPRKPTICLGCGKAIPTEQYYDHRRQCRGDTPVPAGGQLDADDDLLRWADDRTAADAWTVDQIKRHPEDVARQIGRLAAALRRLRTELAEARRHVDEWARMAHYVHVPAEARESIMRMLAVLPRGSRAEEETDG